MKNISDDFREKRTYVNKVKLKREAIKRMKKYKLWNVAIHHFKEENKICYSERGFVYTLINEMQERVNEFEKKNQGLVYHIIKSIIDGQEMWDLLYVPNIKEDWVYDEIDIKNNMVSCYCVVVNDEEYSEYGTINIKWFAGGLIRVS